MSEPSPAKALSERIAACCPCRTNTPCFLSGSAKERTKQSCVCGSHKLKEVDGWRILEAKPCLWPGHAVEAEVGEMDAARRTTQKWLRASRERAEAAEALLTEAPNPGYGQNAQRWTDEEYWPWWKRIRATATK